MREAINVFSPFEVIDYFIPSYHHLEINNIIFETKVVVCQLIIEGKVIDIHHGQIKFNCILPEIENVYIQLEGENWIETNYEKIVCEYGSIDTEYDRNRIINSGNLLKRILNQEDSMGGNNTIIYVPNNIIKRMMKSKIKIKFLFYFQYDQREIPNEIDKYYLPIFCTPSDNSFPSGGYKTCMWLPCLNSANYSTPWNISVVVPTDLIVISSGNFENVQNWENDKKLWKFKVEIPTTPGNICIIVGKFGIYEKENITCYSSPGNSHLLESTIDCIPLLIDFIYQNYNFKLPYKNLNIVFMSQSKKCNVFSNIIIYSSIYLTTACNVIQKYKNQILFGESICELIFGSIILPSTIGDIWLITSICRYVYYNLYRKLFGMCEFSKFYYKEHKIASYFPSTLEDINFYLSPHVFTSGVLDDGGGHGIQPHIALTTWYTSSHPRLLSQKKVWKCFVSRCGITMFYIEKYITYFHLTHVLSKILSNFDNDLYFNHICTEYLFSCILTVTGKDIALQTCRNWFSTSRPLILSLEYAYNRRKSCIDVTITNEEYEVESNIPVNISISVQELDGCFEHNQLINRSVRRSSFEIGIHSSKSRRSNAKRRVITENGREVDIELQRSSNPSKTTDGIANIDNPILWLRVNMEQCSFFGEVCVNQSDSSWYYQASLEANPKNHLKGVKMLRLYGSEDTLLLLTRMVKDKTCWYRIRSSAFESIVEIYNKLTTDEMVKLERDINPIELYRQIFCLTNYPELPKINDFSNVSLYLFQLSAIKSLSKLKLCVLRDSTKSRYFLSYELLRTLYEYNDNVSNIYSDCCYRACLLNSIGKSIKHLKSEFLTDACSFLLVESLNAMKIDELTGYNHCCVVLASLKNLMRLQELKFIPSSSKAFIYCCVCGVDQRLRIRCFKILSKFVKINESIDEYEILIDILQYDPSYIIRKYCIKALTRYPPFQSRLQQTLKSLFNNENFQLKIFSIAEQVLLIENNLSLFYDISQYYHMLYGEGHRFCTTESSEPIVSNITPKLSESGLVKFVINN